MKNEESGEEEEEEKDEDEDEDEEIESTMEQSEDETDNDEEADLEEKSEDAEDMSDFEEEDDYIDSKQSHSTIKTMSETNVRAEIEKGNCVRNQLKLWESLLEMRIKIQKCVVTSNQMPQYNTYKEFKSNMEFSKKVNETKNNLMRTLDNMLQLRDFFLMQYPETKQLCTGSKKRKTDKEENTNTDDLTDEEIPSDTEDEEENEEEKNGEKSSADEDAESAEGPVPRKRLKYNDYERVLSENYNSYKEYRDAVIKKWNDKTRIVVSSLTKKGSGQTTLKQIEFALSDMVKLRKRSQLKRSEYSIVGKSSPVEDNDGRRVQEYDTEIYDDDDFYHQLLRDLIEYKSSDVTDPILLSKQWIQLQNMRKKLKRKIDTRATKGRRVRYNVHNKLVNFMAPITIHDTWTDNAKNELYNSLFGKIKPAEEQVNQ